MIPKCEHCNNYEVTLREWSPDGHTYYFCNRECYNAFRNTCVYQASEPEPYDLRNDVYNFINETYYNIFGCFLDDDYDHLENDKRFVKEILDGLFGKPETRITNWRERIENVR